MVKRFFLFAPVLFAALLLVAVLLAEGGDDQPGHSVSVLARTIAIGCLMGSVVAGLLPKRSDVRLHASVTLATFAVTAVGQSRMNDAPGAVYYAGCVLFGLIVIATLRAPHRWARTAAAARPVPTKGRGRAVAMLAVAWIGVSLLFVTQLPRASRAVERRVQRYFEGYMPEDDDMVGFSSNLQLGSTRRMLQSNRVVMRIGGERVDYLRGAVLDDYDARHQRWSASLDDLRADAPAATPLENTTTRIRMARSAPVAHGGEARWFLPADACDLRSESGHVKLDRAGVAHPDPPTLANEISFRSGPSCGEGAAARRLSVPEAPGPLDLDLTPKLRAQLSPIAARWTPGLTTDRAKLDAIALQLGRFGYSLDVKRNRSIDAVIDLLLVHRVGHCELFASAMALLGRTQGIPTRVVSGYRVTERNAVTGLWIVRERNAHTWVEAWVDGRWDMWDPTPMVEMNARSSVTGWEQTTDVLAWSWDWVARTFWEIGLARIGIFAGVLAVVLLIVRRYTQRAAKTDAGDQFVAARPLPAFDTLATALERAGWARTASEPLEHFAHRIDDGEEPWAADVAKALASYAQLRYGGIGEEKTITAVLESLATKVRPIS